MITIKRPFFYSLLIHTFLLSVFIFAFTYTPKKEPKVTLKLKMISLSAPATPSISKKTVPPQPKKEIKLLPVQKQIPITPTPVIQKTPMPMPTPTVQPTPAVVTQTTPFSPPVETPKIAHPPIAPSVNIEKEFLNAHLGEIRALLIQNLKYPKNAQRLRMQGEVRISFRLKSDGGVENIEVIQSSGFELLDEDAKALIRNTAPQFPKPTKSISLSIPLSYLLH